MRNVSVNFYAISFANLSKKAFGDSEEFAWRSTWKTPGQYEIAYAKLTFLSILIEINVSKCEFQRPIPNDFDKLLDDSI